MSDSIEAVPRLRDSDKEEHHDSPIKDTTDTPEPYKTTASTPTVDLKSLTDRALHFLATASNETLGACLVGLGAGTYLVLGRVGLVLIGVVGGVVLHATWEGHTQNGENNEDVGKSVEARRRELGMDVAHRLLDWRISRKQDKGSHEDDASDLSLKLYSGKKLDYSEFKPETATALTELTDAVIRDYVKYVVDPRDSYISNMMQMVVLACTPHRRGFSRFVSADIDSLYAVDLCTSLAQAAGG